MEKWMEADRVAVEVNILGFAENGKCRIDDPDIVSNPGLLEEGVMDRKLKTDNGYLAESNAFKSRYATDSKRGERKRRALGMSDPTPSYAITANPQIKKSFLADTTETGKTLVKGDVTDFEPLTHGGES